MNDLLIRRRLMQSAYKYFIIFRHIVPEDIEQTISFEATVKGLKVLWGDGTIDSKMSHTYSAGEEREIEVKAYGYFDMFHAPTTITYIDIRNSSPMKFFGCFNCKKLTEFHGEGWDASKLVKFGHTNNVYGGMFMYCSKLGDISIEDWNISNKIAMMAAFSECKSMKRLILPPIKCTTLNQAFDQMFELVELDVTKLDVRSTVDMSYAFRLCYAIKSLIGDKTLEDVEGEDGEIVAMSGTKVNLSLSNSSKLRYSSMLAVTKGLADLTGQTAQTISFNITSWNNMFNDDDTVPTSDVIAERKATLSAIAASKNWNLSY